MLKGFRTVIVAMVIFTAVGAVLGALVGVVAQNVLLWAGLTALVGAGFGIWMGYGFLPEQ